MNKNRVERTSANDLAGQVQENAAELVRSVGDVDRKVHSRTALYGYTDCIGYRLAARQNT